MVAKVVVLLALAVVAVQGQTITDITLPDETTTHLSNQLIPKTISIPMFFFDTLVSCHVIFPNGVVYELAPTSSLPQNQYISSIGGNCGLGFRNAPPEMSGTYELISRIDHLLDGTSSRTRQRFHLTFYYSDSWQLH